MKRCICVSLLALALSLALAVTLPRWMGPPPIPEAGSAPAAEPAVFYDADGMTVLRLLHKGEVKTMTLAEYLPGVLAGEMPADFAPAALCAQAVAARTYALQQRRKEAHPQADVCSDPACYQVWLDEAEQRARWGEDEPVFIARMRAAVAATNGEYLTYEGEPILCCFHSSSAGYTESSANLWGEALPYLVSVESPETAADVPDYVSRVEVSAQEFREVILSRFPEAELKTTLPPDWLGARSTDTSGRVAGVRVGGVAIPGTEMRSLFGLRSACFDLAWTGMSFRFTVTGYGHGAGMSQYGANVMARGGADYREILAHYYPGTELKRLRFFT